MKKIFSKKSSKIIIALLSIILVVFLCWNIIWFAFIQVRYKPFIDVVGYNDKGICTVVKEDNYRYTVFKPPYLTFRSNLVITENIPLNDGNIDYKCKLFIWPKFFGGYEFGFAITTPKPDSKDGEVSFSTKGFMLDEKMNPVEPLSEADQDFLKENKEYIKMMYDKAYKMWGIGEPQ